jgi:hypothetical protein
MKRKLLSVPLVAPLFRYQRVRAARQVDGNRSTAPIAEEENGDSHALAAS